MDATSNDLRENSNASGWGDLAEKLLCAGTNAHGITDALKVEYPGNDWFVLVQDELRGWAANLASGEYHTSYGLCGKDMFVWKYAGSVQGCNSSSQTLAQTLIDDATNQGFPYNTDIREYIKEGGKAFFLITKFYLYFRRG